MLRLHTHVRHVAGLQPHPIHASEGMGMPGLIWCQSTRPVAAQIDVLGLAS
jgi:hypothetical protein